MMTKHEVESQLNYYRNKVAKLEEIQKQMDQVLVLDDYDKPLKKYSIAEMSLLNEINSEAFDYLTENEDKNINDYNYQASSDKQVALQG